MAPFVYILCCITSIICAGLLWRAYRRRPVARLLFWSSCCFIALALNNIVLIVDVMVGPDIDLSIYRDLLGAAGVGVLLFGLIWDAHET